VSKVLVIVGPTAIGKSSLSINLAKRFNGEIINGDSIQVYKELNIASAKITKDEMNGIPHHLLDYKEVTDDYNVAIFQQDGRKAIEDITSRGKLPIVCGGTGLYIKALLYDYTFLKQEETISNDYSQYSNEQLFEMLKQLDYQSSLTIHPNNRKRVIRALDMAKSGSSKSEQEAKQEHKLLYDAKIISLTMDREKLRNRIDQRIEVMLNQGLLDEINYLFGKYPYDLHCFQGIGYKEFIPYHKNIKTLQECIEDVKTHTKQFAKRQYTWFRNQMPVDWYDIENKDYPNNVYKDVEEFLK
jgi:tRNA dimethylallyltransferase